MPLQQCTQNDNKAYRLRDRIVLIQDQCPAVVDAVVAASAACTSHVNLHNCGQPRECQRVHTGTTPRLATHCLTTKPNKSADVTHVATACHPALANSTLIRNAVEDLLGEDFEGRFESKYLART
ncbi:hypothetical protein, partial [Xanthomonas oryzae]|uniref:hypothetical protein n=1 Tax=Xanthomonas oryzae TaxID=347 RepID=UPI001C67E402